MMKAGRINCFIRALKRVREILAVIPGMLALPRGDLLSSERS